MRFGSIFASISQGLFAISQVQGWRNSRWRTNGVVTHGQVVLWPINSRELLPVGTPSSCINEHGFRGTNIDKYAIFSFKFLVVLFISRKNNFLSNSTVFPNNFYRCWETILQDPIVEKLLTYQLLTLGTILVECVMYNWVYPFSSSLKWDSSVWFYYEWSFID